MSSTDMPFHDGPQYRRYRASLPTDEDKDDVDVMISMLDRPNSYTPEDLELSFACRMEKDELIQAHVRDKITIEECLQKSKEIARRHLSGGGTTFLLPTAPHAEMEKYWKASEEYINTLEEDNDYDQIPVESSTGPAYQRFRATLPSESERLGHDRFVFKERQLYSDAQIEQSYTTQFKVDEDFRAAKCGKISYKEWLQRRGDDNDSSPKMMPITTIRSAIPYDEIIEYSKPHESYVRGLRPAGSALTMFDGEFYQQFRSTLATEDEKVLSDAEADKLLDTDTESDVDRIYCRAWRDDQLFRAVRDGTISYEQFLGYNKPTNRPGSHRPSRLLPPAATHHSELPKAPSTIPEDERRKLHGSHQKHRA